MNDEAFYKTALGLLKRVLTFVILAICYLMSPALLVQVADGRDKISTHPLTLQLIEWIGVVSYAVKMTWVVGQGSGWQKFILSLDLVNTIPTSTQMEVFYTFAVIPYPRIRIGKRTVSGGPNLNQYLR